MAKQLNVNLAFTADTSNAKSQIQDLQNQLKKLGSGTGISSQLPITKEIQEARIAADELKVHLEKAINTKTGTLDFTKLNQSIQQSGTSLQAYGQKLQSLGSEGQQAFSSLAKAIANSEIPLKRSSALLDEFATTMKNTVRWQLSSSMMHGFLESIQSAYSYAQSLDRSLTDIQIVTGNSSSYMADFAEKANTAAQSLSTTTKTYADASLIFFQQGLDEEDVLQRTDTTIKMAQATGDTVDQVSSYMTAIWNNFYDGSESLEHYADVITKLGAATASSSSEIAEGIQQFAGIGKTIGLSYDYATAALTTLTANTRQSASEIGNSLKTIFSRFQGLKLGETLEDGVDLNKYSNALKKIGVDIIDVNGEMKDMDNILDETASRWDGLTKAQKMAFAETAAGTMQYTKLVSLMDNWDDMKQNLEFAGTADGTLEEQAEIYADSWEGARKRVRAAWEEIYNDLLDENAFKGALNGLTSILNLVDKIIDSAGGLKGVLSGISSILIGVFQKQLSEGLSNMIYSLNMATKIGKEKQEQSRSQFLQDSAKTMAGYSTDTEMGTISGADQMKIQVFQDELNLKDQLIQKSQEMSEAEKLVTQELLDQQSALGQIAVEKKKEADATKEKRSNANDALMERAYQREIKESSQPAQKDSKGNNIPKFTVNTDEIISQKKALEEDVIAVNQLNAAMTKLRNGQQLTDKEFQDLDGSLKKLSQSAEATKTSQTGVHEALREAGEEMTTLGDKADLTSEKLTKIKAAIKNDIEGGTGNLAALTGATGELENDQAAKNYVNTLHETVVATNEANQANENYRAGVERTEGALNRSGNSNLKWSDGLVKAAQGVTSLMFAFNSLSSIINTVKDPDMSAWEKTTSIMMSLSMAIPSLITGLTALKDAHLKTTATTIAHNIAESALGKTLALTLVKIGLTVTGHLAQAKALNAATVAQVGLNAAMSANPIGAIIAGLTILVGALAAVTAGVYALIKASQGDTSLEDNLAKSKKEVDSFTSALKDAKTKASEIESDFDKYTTVTEALANCTQGTEEWATQMSAVQDTVNDLIAKYPTLAKYLQYDKNGTPSISQEGFDKVKEEQEKNQLAVQGAQYQAKIRESQDQNKVTENANDEIQEKADEAKTSLDDTKQRLISNLLDQYGDLFSEDEITSILEDAFTKGIDSETVKSAVEQAVLLKMAQDKSINNDTDMFYKGSKASSQEKKDYIRENGYAQEASDGFFGIGKHEATDGTEEFNDDFNARMSDILDVFDSSVSQYAESSQNYTDANSKLTNAENDLTSAQKDAEAQQTQYNQAMAAQLLANSDYVQKMSDSSQFLARAGEQYGDFVKEKIEKASDNYDDNYQQYLKDYLQQVKGIDGVISEIKKDKEGNISSYKVNGEEQKETVNKQDIIDFEGSKAAVEEFSKDMEDNFIQSLEDSGNAVQAFAKKSSDSLTDAQSRQVNDAVQSFGVNKDLSDISYSQNQALNDSGITPGAISQGKITAEDLGITDEMAQNLGHNSADEYVKAFGESLQENNQAFNAISKMDGFEGLSENIKNQMSTGIASGIEDIVDKMELGPMGEQSGLAFMSGLQSALGDADADKVKDGLQAILDTDWTDNDSISDLSSALSDLGITVDTTSDAWQGFEAAMRASYGTMMDMSSIASNFDQLSSLQDAKAGETVKTDDIAPLLQMFPQLSNYLIDVDDKTKAWTADFDSIQGMDLSSIIGQMQTLASWQEAVSNPADGGLNLKDLLGDVDTESLDSMKQGLDSIMQDTNATNLCSQLGYSKEALDNLCQNGTQEELQQLYDTLNNFMNADYDISGLAEKLASTAKTTQELQDMWDSGALGDNVDAFNKKFEELQNTVDSDVDTDALDNLADHLQENCDKVEDLSDELKDNAKQARKTAESILRYDSAVEDVTKNYDDWMDALNAGDLQEQVEVGKELANIYGDMFDMDGSSLSDSFLTSADNLELLKQAANGSEEAYAELQDRMQQDIEAQLNLDDTNFFDEKAAVEAAMDEMNFEDIEVGASLDTGNFYSQLEDLVNSAGMTAQQATDYLASMGIDAELETVEKKEPVQKTVNSLVPNITYQSASEPVVAGDGKVSNQTILVPSITYSAQPQAIEDTNAAGGFSLKVKSANKASGGGFKYKNSSNGGGSRGSGGHGGGGRGRGGRGGGGRGSGRAARNNTEQTKKNKDEIERYHTISKQLESLTKQYDKISKAKDRAYGTSKVKLMDQEIAKQKQIIAKQKEYLKAAKKNLAIDKKRLQNGKTTYTDSKGKQQTVASGAKNYVGKEALFDNSGNITNYEELMKAAIKKYNAAVKEFNSHTTEDEAAKAKFEAAKQQYEGFTGWLKQYEETNELIADKAQDVIDAENELYDQRFEKTQYIMEIKIEVNDKKLEYLEYLLDKVDDSAHDAAEAIKLLGDTAQNALDARKINLQGLNDMFNNGNHKNLEGKGNLAKKMAAGDKDTIALLSKEKFTDDEIKQIQDVMSNLLDINKKLREARQQIFEKMDDAFEDGIDKMDRLINKQKHFQTMTESYGNIIDIVGKKSLGITSAMMKTYNANKVKQATDLLAESKTKVDSIQQQIDAADAARKKARAAGHTEDVKMWDESIKKMEDELQDAKEDFMSNWEEALQAARDAFDNNVENMVDDFSSKIGGLSGSIAALQEKWDQNKTLEEEYVPQYEKIYQLTKLTRNITKSIDETKNVKAKRELASLQEEINGLQDKSKTMSEYDLQYLQKRYELKVAEMALEDAQNAKSQVRMTKDSEGNFSYVYTADEQQVAEAEQSYEDKLHEMQQMNAEYMNTLQENMIKMKQEQAEKVAELSELYEIGSAEYQEALDNLQKYYAKQMTYYSGQMENVLSNNTNLYENDVKNYGELTNNKAMVDEEYIGNFSQTQLSVATGYENMEDLQSNWNQAADEMYKAVGKSAEDYAAQNEAAMEAAGTSMDDYANTMSNDVAQMTSDSDDLRTEMDDTAEQINSDFETVVDSVKAFEDQYSASIDSIVESNEELYESFLKVVQAHSKFKAVTSDDNKGSDGDTNGGQTPTQPNKNKNKNKNKDNSNKAEGVAAAIWIWGDHSGWGDDPERAKKLKEKGVSNAQAIINAKAENGWLYNKYWDKRFEVREKYSYGKFDTGGYTGDWSGEGRFAMLHQKEIVLNKDDTENFLKTVDIVRQISDMIDLNAMSASGGLGSLFAASVNKDNDVLEQNVHITAEFPNATNKDEILSAFDNVVNLASQYANRKR
jgi:TP901 family phage tail tape measure protein